MKPRGWIKQNSKSIANRYFKTFDKTKVGREFGITRVGVERALFYQKKHDYIAPAHLRHFRGDDTLLPRLNSLSKRVAKLEGQVPLTKLTNSRLIGLYVPGSKEIRSLRDLGY